MNLRSGLAVGAGILPAQCRPQFEEGVQLILSKWTALELAVEQEWGGRQSGDKAENMLDELLEWFDRKRGHSLSELEALLETIMLEDFNVQAEDGSPAQVGQALLHWYQQCLAGDFTLIEQLRSVSSGAKKSRGEMVDNDGAAVAMGDQNVSSRSSSSSSGQDSMDHDGENRTGAAMEVVAVSKLQGPVVDDDGFTLVQRGRRRR